MLPEDKHKYTNCILKDISMTGMGIISRQRIDQEARIQISFTVNEEKNEILVGNISQEHEFKNGTGYFYNCDFDEPNEIIGKFVTAQYERMNQINRI